MDRFVSPLVDPRCRRLFHFCLTIETLKIMVPSFLSVVLGAAQRLWSATSLLSPARGVVLRRSFVPTRLPSRVRPTGVGDAGTALRTRRARLC